MTINLWVTDNHGKAVRGGSLIRGREGSIEILKVSHGIYLPYDPDTTLIQGTCKHSPLTVLKNVDQASPFFAKACCNGMILKEIKLELYHINPMGQETPLYRYTLHNARIASIQPLLSSGYLENISFIYEKITWLFINGHYAYTDTWREK